jgi:putative SOS response-associated peptidase YedK
MCYSVEVEKELLRIRQRFMAELSMEDEERYLKLLAQGEDLGLIKEVLGLKRRPQSNPIKGPDADGRIYPGSFTHVLAAQRKLIPMRYRLRPAGSKEEIPSKYNVFNARIDSLLLRDTWRPLLGRRHGVLAFKRFFEWVEQDGRKRIISFSSQRYEFL